MMNNDRFLLEQAYASVFEMAYGIAGEGSAQQRITKDELIEKIKQAEREQPGTSFISLTQVTKESTNKAPLPSFVLSGLKNGKAYFAKVTQLTVQTGASCP